MKNILMIAVLALAVVVSIISLSNNKPYKTVYKEGTCLTENRRDVASFSKDRTQIYKVKKYKKNSYTLYARHRNAWWYFREIPENDLLDRSVDVIKCPDLKPSLLESLNES
ncbi:MAG: hypothetical protein ACPGJV_06020 [Bacteriovoracaceae bacterium]